MTPEYCFTCHCFACAKQVNGTPIYGECRGDLPTTDGSIPFQDINARFGKFPLMMADGWCDKWKPRRARVKT